MSSAGIHDRAAESSLLAVMLVCLLVSATARAQSPGNEEICDTEADYALGNEDYPEAIRLHLQVIHRNPRDPVAHYHLGFAYGMIRDRDSERAQYHTALALGGVQWSILLNLGLSYFDEGKYSAAIEYLNLAASAGPSHPETHYDLGLAYERSGTLAFAERELLASLRLDPAQPDARNMLALVHAEQGKRSQARREWTEIVRGYPRFQPARENLRILDAQSRTRSMAALKDNAERPTNVLILGDQDADDSASR